MKKLWDISPPIAPDSPLFPGDEAYTQRWTARIGPGCSATPPGQPRTGRPGQPSRARRYPLWCFRNASVRLLNSAI